MTGDSENAVPPFDGTPRSIMVLKKAAKILQASGTPLAEQARQLEPWIKDNATRFDADHLASDDFQLDRDRWTKVANRPVSYSTKDLDIPRLAWHWFFENHRHAIVKPWLTEPDAYPDIPNPLVPTLHTYLSPKEPEPNLTRLHHLEGHYAVYRPSFIDTDEIMVMAMQCGVDGDLSRFQAAMSFINDDGEPHDEHVGGFALPYQDSILFQGWLVEAAAPFVFILSGFPVDTKTGKILKGDGTLLVGAGGAMSSAYPITIRRVAKPIAPCTYDLESFQKTVPAHKAILSVMARGRVGWR